MPGHVAIIITGDFGPIMNSLYEHLRTFALPSTGCGDGINTYMGVDFYFTGAEEGSDHCAMDLIRNCNRRGYRSLFVVYTTNYITRRTERILRTIRPLIKHGGMMMVCLTPIETAEELSCFCRDFSIPYIITERVPDAGRLLEGILFNLRTTANDDVLQGLPMPWECR